MNDYELTIADAITQYLEEINVTTIFGNPGTTELPFVESVEESYINYRVGLHEDVAVGMAAGFGAVARYSDFDPSGLPLGVVNLHTSGGLAHGLGNLYGARMGRVPLLVLVGTQSTDFRHENPILSDNCQRMVEQHCRWSEEITEADTAIPLVKKAVRTALTPPRGPSALMLPLNLCNRSISDPNLGTSPLSSLGTANREDLQPLLSRCRESSSIGIIVGDEIGRHGRETVSSVVQLAESTNALVFGEILMAECNFPTDHRQWISVLPPDLELAGQLLELDTVIFLGCNHQTGLFRSETPLVKDAYCIQINTCPEDPGRSHPVDLAISGNIPAILEQMHDELRNTIPKNVLDERHDLIGPTKTLVDAQLEEIKNTPESTKQCTQQDVVECLNNLSDDYFLVDEGVSGRYELLTEGILRPERYLSNKGGALGYGLPLSVGAAVAIEKSNKSLPVVCYIGDGSFWYYPQSLYTADRLSLNLTVVVLKNNRYQILEDNAETMTGEAPDLGSTQLNELSESKAAVSQNIRIHEIDSRDQLTSLLPEEINRDSPSLLEVRLATLTPND